MHFAFYERHFAIVFYAVSLKKSRAIYFKLFYDTAFNGGYVYSHYLDYRTVRALYFRQNVLIRLGSKKEKRRVILLTSMFLFCLYKTHVARTFE